MFNTKTYFIQSSLILLLAMSMGVHGQYYNKIFRSNDVQTLGNRITLREDKIFLLNVNADPSCFVCLRSTFNIISARDGSVDTTISDRGLYERMTAYPYSDIKWNHSLIYTVGTIVDTQSKFSYAYVEYDTLGNRTKYVVTSNLPFPLTPSDIVLVNSNRIAFAGFGGKVRPFRQVPYLVIMDTLGNRLYDRLYDTTLYYDFTSVWAKSIMPLEGGDLLLVSEGIKNDYDVPAGVSTKYATILIRVDSNGNEKWHKMLPDTSMRVAYSFQKTDDGGYISCGSYVAYRGTVDNPSPSYKFLPAIAKWDSNFNMVWMWYEMSTAYTNIGEFYDCSTMPNGDIIACGYQGNYIDGKYFPGGFIQKMDKNGNIKWKKFYQPKLQTELDKDFQFYDLELANNGDIIAVGDYNPNAPPLQYCWLMRVDSNGCFADTNFCGWDSNARGPNIIHVSDGMEIHMYPNPSYEDLNFELYHSSLHYGEKLNVVVYDVHGREVMREEMSYSERMRLDVREFSGGIYFLHIGFKDNKPPCNVKFVKL